MSTHILEQNESDRQPSAAFFDTTRKFYDYYRDLLPEGHGLIAMQKTDDAVDALILDARHHDENEFTWQFSHTSSSNSDNYLGTWNSAQEIVQVTVRPSSISGVRKTLNRQGALVKSSELKDKGLDQKMIEILQMLEGPAASDEIEKRLRARRLAHERVPRGAEFADALSAERIKDLKRDRKIASSTGFIALAPY